MVTLFPNTMWPKDAERSHLAEGSLQSRRILTKPKDLTGLATVNAVCTIYMLCLTDSSLLPAGA